MNSYTRRDLLRFSALSAMNAYAQVGASDYKALVCVFLQGGNDGNNMVLPMGQAEFDAYKAIRGNLSLPDGSAKLLPVQNSVDGSPIGLNDGLKGLHPLWAQGKLAAVANMGNLVRLRRERSTLRRQGLCQRICSRIPTKRRKCRAAFPIQEEALVGPAVSRMRQMR